MSGPLAGYRVIELAGIGPVPFAGMLLADLGAEVIRIDRATGETTVSGTRLPTGILDRGRRRIGIDLRNPAGVEVVHRLAATADVVMEGMRPGVAERLGVGPGPLLALNPALIYGRMTGWGQTGSRAHDAGHDINYVGLAGALHPLGARNAPPPAPLNLIGDLGGGAMYLLFGICSALLERVRSGRGQVVEAAMVDGVASMTALFQSMLAAGEWTTRRESNLVDGAAPFYRCYATSDNEFMAVGAIEDRFYRALLERLGLDPADWPQHDRSAWPRQSRHLEQTFATRTRAEWTEIFAGSEACVTPVLSLAEAPDDPHLRGRATFLEVDGTVQPAPAPRFDRTVPAPPGPGVSPRRHTTEILRELGLTTAEIDRLRRAGAVA
jgi:alpha-methylacyl-CoA racemase